jgi:hypothetical protein
MGLFRFGLGQINIQLGNTNIVKLPPGDLSEVVPPVLFPNTEVKRFSADDTEGEGSCGKYVIARRLFFNLFNAQLSPFWGIFCFKRDIFEGCLTGGNYNPGVCQ